MPFVVTQPSGSLLSPGSFSRRFTYASGWESDRVVDVAKLAKKGQTKVNLISDKDGKDYGFIALSLTQLNKRMALVVDFIFVSPPYRGLKYAELEDKKISDFLLGYPASCKSSFILLLNSVMVLSPFPFDFRPIGRVSLR